MTRSSVKKVRISLLGLTSSWDIRADHPVFVSPAVVEELKRIIRDSEITKYVLNIQDGILAVQLEHVRKGIS